MAAGDKFTLIDELAQIGDLIFVGSCAMYLQGYASDFKDIDVLVTTTATISRFFEIIEIEESVFKFDNRERAFLSKYDIGVDIFVSDNIPESIVTISGKKCISINSQIAFFEKTLSYNTIPNDLKQKFTAENNYLKTIRIS